MAPSQPGISRCDRSIWGTWAPVRVPFLGAVMVLVSAFDNTAEIQHKKSTRRSGAFLAWRGNGARVPLIDRCVQTAALSATGMLIESAQYVPQHTTLKHIYCFDPLKSHLAASTNIQHALLVRKHQKASMVRPVHVAMDRCAPERRTGAHCDRLRAEEEDKQPFPR